MADNEPLPPLKPLHLDEVLVASKLSAYAQLTTSALIESLKPGVRDCLKTRIDGTIIDGHHRIHVLRNRGVDVDSLPREVIVKEEPPQ